ncbi:MAG: phosphoribosyltransferase family protein [Bryobacterales bacterium]|nr:phosphoribosyltransferase family protein [Bryobacterales bacterium]
MVPLRASGLPGQGPVLIPRAKIAERVKELGDQIAREYAEILGPLGQRLQVGVVLNGAWLFAADLVRELGLRGIGIDTFFLQASSYGGSTESSGRVEIRFALDGGLSDATVLLVEDIVDSGRTAEALFGFFSQRTAGGLPPPKSVRLASLLSKPSRRVRDVPIHYLGFEIPDVFVVGYGMDYKGRYRHLPEVHGPPEGVG